MTDLGVVRAIARFPVKSMAGEALEEADVGWNGIDGDRRYAFVQEGSTSGFPWLTIRQLPQLLRYRPLLREDGEPDVETPSGARLPIRDPALAAELSDAHGGPVRLLRDRRGLFDARAVSFITTATVDEVARRAGLALDPSRFRMNLVVEAAHAASTPEQGWIGTTVAVGEVHLRVDLPDERCMVVNFDPHTVERRPEVLRTVARDLGRCAGVYASVERPGRLRVGDPVRAVAR